MPVINEKVLDVTFNSVNDLLGDAALRYPDKTAIKFNDISITYGELNSRTSQLANYLISNGVVKGDFIGVLMERSIELIVSILAIVKTGGVYIPLDPYYPDERILFMLEDSSAKFLLTAKKYENRFSSVATKLFIEDFSEQHLGISDKTPEVRIGANDLIYILYTSGSTGKPKGVMMEHHNLTNYLNSISKTPGISDKDVLLGLTTISFDISALEIYLPLINGAQLLLFDEKNRKDARVILDCILKENITIIQGTPSLYRTLIEIGWKDSTPVKVFCSGEALSKDLAESILPLCQCLWNMYGPTETTIHSTIKEIKKDDTQITIGKPIENTSIYILDDNSEPVEKGAIGEIYIGGRGVSRGYLNRPELTAKTFLKNPFNPEEGAKIYKTGDLGKFLPNGEILYLGRSDAQVKIRGFRIELGEIEYHLNKSDNIRESVVIAREDQPGNLRLVAYLCLKKYVNDSFNNEAAHSAIVQSDYISEVKILKSNLGVNLPEFMVPSNFVILDSLPKTPNGKIDRKALPVPEKLQIKHKDDSDAPLTYEELLLIEIWGKILNIEVVKRNDSFFELGGNSLLAIKLLSEIEKNTGIALQLSVLFEFPTVQKLAELLKSNNKSNTRWDALVSIKPTGNKTPVYLIHGGGLGVYIFHHISLFLDNEQPIYCFHGLGTKQILSPLRKVEEIAAFYVSELIEHNPEGPYALAGHSAGGLLAFEMAKQLKSAGKEIKLLAIFDYDMYDSNAHHPIRNKIKRYLSFFFPSLVFKLRRFKENPVKTMRHERMLWGYKKLSFLRKFGLEKPTRNEGSDLVLQNSIEIFESAISNYEIKPYEGILDLFISEDKAYYQKDPKYMGWLPFAAKGVNSHLVPGNHDNMLLPPNSKEFSRILQEVLDRN